MFMFALNQKLASSQTKKYLVAATAILLTISNSACPGLAKESEKETDKKADTTAATVPDNSAWDAYVDDLEKQIIGKWFPPSGISKYKGVKVEIRIRKDGRLSRTNVTRSSQILKVDEAAKKAINNAAPYKPFPDGVKKEDFATFEVKLDKSDIDAKRKIVRKIDKFSKPEKDDTSKLSF
jgi:TonB family protein